MDLFRVKIYDPNRITLHILRHVRKPRSQRVHHIESLVEGDSFSAARPNCERLGFFKRLILVLLSKVWVLFIKQLCCEAVVLILVRDLKRQVALV